jgi:hypothetical protein
MTQGVRYTEEEMANIRMVHASGRSYKSMAHLWPTRKPIDVARQATNMGLGPRPVPISRSGSFVLPALLEAVRKHPGKAYDIAEKLRINKEYAGRLLRIQSVAKPQTVHIQDWVRSRPGGIWVEYWVAGPGANAEKPQPTPRYLRKRAKRAEVRAAKANPFRMIFEPVCVPKSQPGRIYIHLTDSKEMEEA